VNKEMRRLTGIKKETKDRVVLSADCVPSGVEIKRKETESHGIFSGFSDVQSLKVVHLFFRYIIVSYVLSPLTKQDAFKACIMCVII